MVHCSNPDTVKIVPNWQLAGASFLISYWELQIAKEKGDAF